MAESIKILRRSFHVFCRSYHCLASAAALLAVPYSIATLFSQSMLPSSSSLLRTVSSRLWLLFEASGFPSSHFFSLLNVKLSQALFSFVSTLPFNATFLLLAKAFVFQVVAQAPPPPSHPRRRVGRFWLPSPGSLLQLYPSLLLTHLFNSFFVLSANAAVLALLFVAFSVIDFFDVASSGLTLAVSVAGVILYSLALANALVTCNMAMAVAAMEHYGGHLAVLEALVLVQGRMAVAVTLALPASLGVATVEALFHYLIIRPYTEYLRPRPPAIWETLIFAYLYSLLLVFDAIVTCIFVKSCKVEEKDAVQV